MPENLYNALNLARNIRLQNEQDARNEANGMGKTVRSYNVDAED